MDKKIIAIAIATIMVFLGASVITSAKSISQNKEKTMMGNQDVILGSASIYGDGVEGNSDVDADATKDITIKIQNDPELVDLIMDYSIQCDGALDQGRVYLFAQLNGVEIDNVSIIEEETHTGQIIIENVEVKNRDVLTFEIGCVYTNFDPFFTDPDVDIGGGIFIKHRSRSLENIFFDSPLLQFLQKIPIFFRLFY